MSGADSGSGARTQQPGTQLTVFRPSPAAALIALGRWALISAGLAVVIVVVSATGPAWLRTVTSLLLLLALVVTLALGARVVLRLAGRGPRLVLDEQGYTNTTGRAPRRVEWVAVRRLAAVTGGGRLVLEAALADGRTSTVLLRRLGSAPTAVEAAMRERLNTANGYTELR